MEGKLMNIRFLGAAQNVTGSNYVLEVNGRRVMIDCGMYQERKLKDRNWEPFAIDPHSVDAVLLTHGHLDHCGRLPKLVREGFAGRIICTPATADIAGIVMQDAARLAVEDAEFKQRRHEREGRTGPHPVVPLYTPEDAEACLPLFESVNYGIPFAVTDGVEVTFFDGGHILGSSMLRVTLTESGRERTVIFSGDVGQWDTPLLNDPTEFEEADYVVVESTYGDRTHGAHEGINDALADVINETRRRGGNVVIPSFAIERTQELIYRLNELLGQDRIPHLPVFIDSPMAIRVTEVFRRHRDLFDAEATALLEKGDHPCDFPGLIMSRTVDQSKAINHIRGTTIVIAGSGMCTGGRIKHHLSHNIGREESTILFVGYQAVGTLGRIILDGVNPVRIHGQEHDVRARIEKISGFSAHADRNDLYRWVSCIGNPRKVFVTHGEPDAAKAFASLVRDKKAWRVAVPAYGDAVDLE
jgi:metallo-beta-lactamase family protein